MKIQVEYTDTYGGEANYSWVERHEIDGENLTDSQVIRQAKAAVGLTGVKCDREPLWGQAWGFKLKPRGCCTVLFITCRE